MIATEIIAHRGLSCFFPENTAIAMKGAAKIGAAWVEADVQVLADGVPVIIHDLEWNRTTNLRGLVSKSKEDVLIETDAGSWFDEKFRRERVLTLFELLELIYDLDLGLMLEIKHHSEYHDNFSAKEIEDLVHSIMKVIAVAPKPPRGLIVSSFFVPFLEVVKKYDKLQSAVIGPLYMEFDQRCVEEATQLGAKSVQLPKELLLDDGSGGSEKLVALAKSAGLDIYVFTVNEIADAEKLFLLGIDGIITDYPQQYKRYLL